jgi:hypothetical protein
MRLFKFHETWDGNEYCALAHRWVCNISLTGIDFLLEYFNKDDLKWYSARTYFNVSLTKYWFWGSDHYYYDGPHCSFSVGFLHFGWNYWWCKKCRPDDT